MLFEQIVGNRLGPGKGVRCCSHGRKAVVNRYHGQLKVDLTSCITTK